MITFFFFFDQGFNHKQQINKIDITYKVASHFFYQNQMTHVRKDSHYCENNKLNSAIVLITDGHEVAKYIPNS